MNKCNGKYKNRCVYTYIIFSITNEATMMHCVRYACMIINPENLCAGT